MAQQGNDLPTYKYDSFCALAALLFIKISCDTTMGKDTHIRVYCNYFTAAGTIDSGTYRCGVLGGPKDDFQDKSINVVSKLSFLYYKHNTDQQTFGE